MEKVLLFPGTLVARAGEKPDSWKTRRRTLIKGFIVMKLLLLLTVIACLQGSAKSYGQAISLSLKNVSLEKVFSEIQKQTHYLFIYTNEEIENARPVTIEVKNASLEKVLDICLKQQPLDYSLQEPYVIIKRKKENKPVLVSEEMTTIIRGKVINEKGEGIAGATVALKGTTIATACDDKGEFVLEFTGNYTTLIFSSVGCATKEVLIDKQSYINVTLQTVINSLDETVVMAYGHTTRRFNTGSIAKVSGEDISKQPVSNSMAALQGRVPGLIVTQSSGIPGSSFKVEIRGRSALDLKLSKNDPLFVVDGVPFDLGNGFLGQILSAAGNPATALDRASGLSPLNTINPADIESIEVLKDADATAIYGSRGANGVILITTKKATIGKTRVNVNIRSGWSKVSRTMNMLNTRQYLQMRKEAFLNDGLAPTITTAPDLLAWDSTRYTDFKKLLIGGTAHMTDAQVSVAGGTINTQFIVGGGYHRETTVFPGDLSDSRGSIHVNLNNISPSRKTTINLTANYTSERNNLTGSDLTSFINLPPNLPSLYDSAGKLNWQYGGVSFVNPLSYLLKKYTAKTGYLLSNLQLGYKVLPGLTIKSNFGYYNVHVNEAQINPISSQNPASNPLGFSQFGNNTTESWIFEPQAEYNKKIKKGILNVLVGGTWKQNSNNRIYVSASGYTNDALLQSVSGAGSVSASNGNSKYRYSAVFSRLNYNWQDKYIINLNGRRDGSSRFGPGKQFASFGSVGAAWILSNENFFSKRLSFISFGKLRASYGTVGNDQIGDYQYLDSWSGTNNPYQGAPGLTPTRLFNSKYSWEINRKSEVAIELAFLKDKIQFSTAFFRNRSSNQLINYRLPALTGFISIIQNLPALVQNHGFEFVLSTTNITTSQFSWTNSLNLTIPRNKLISFPDLARSTYANTYAEGKPLNVIRGYQFLGVDPVTGIFQFEDIDKDGNLSIPNDFVVSGNFDPKLYGGFRNNINYKGWQLDIFFEFKKQVGQNYLATQAAMIPGRYNVQGGNQPMIVLNRWQKPGDITNIQRFTTRTGTPTFTAASINLLNSDGIYSDASYIRLKNVSFSYNLLSAWLSRIDIESVRIYLQAQNLATITKYVGADPENQNLYRLPPLRSIVAGIQFTF